MAISFSTASERYTTKFPLKSLKSFAGVDKPCTIHCELHGEVEAATYYSVMNSKHGCPICGREASRRKSAARLTPSDTANPVLEDVLAYLQANNISLLSYKGQTKEALAHDLLLPAVWSAVHKVIYEYLTTGKGKRKALSELQRFDRVLHEHLLMVQNTAHDV